jgi:metallo-beta-lactamase class B
MKTIKRLLALTAASAAFLLQADLSSQNAMAQGQAAANEPYSKTCRVTRARDNSIQNIEPTKIFDNLYLVGPCYVSVWLLTTPQGDILFDTTQEPFVDHVIDNIKKVGVNLRDIKYIVLSHGHSDHVGGAAKIQEATGARVVAISQDWDMMAALEGKQGNRDGGGINKMPKKDMVVKEGDHLDLGDQHLTFHWTPGHTPGVLTTEGIKVYDNGTPHTAILMGGGGYRGGLKEAQQSLESAKKVAAIKGVEVNLQIHSWAEPNGYPGGGVLERTMMMKNRKPGDPNPFVDPATYNSRAQAAVTGAERAIAREQEKANGGAK